MALERYTDEEKKFLAQLCSENKGSTADDIAKLAVESEQFGSRTADALRQRIFKLLREKKAKRAAKESPAAKAAPKTKGQPRKAPAPQIEAPVEIVATPRQTNGHSNGNGHAVSVPVALSGDELELQLAGGAKVKGSPSGIAALIKGL